MLKLRSHRASCRRRQLGFVAVGWSGFNVHNRRRIFITSQTADFNVGTFLGNPAGPVEVEIHNLGQNVYGSNTSSYGLICNGLAAGSHVILFNIYSGNIWGCGGAGASANSGAGGAGGHAILLGTGVHMTVHNGGGAILGGGGGGGAGTQVSYFSVGCGAATGGGGGGGGGQGFQGGAGGGATAAGQSGLAVACGGLVNGSVGGAGSSGGPGGGGARGQATYMESDGKNCNCIGPVFGTAGASGGGVGAVGGNSTGAGGAAGKAINLNGGTATIISTGTIAGAVS